MYDPPHFCLPPAQCHCALQRRCVWRYFHGLPQREMGSTVTTNTNQQLALVQQVLVSDDMQRQMSTVLPPSIRIDKFTEVTIAAIQNNPDVLQADKESLYRACLASARRGLLPDKREGALVVYNTNVGTKDQPSYVKMVQFLPMVEGIIKEMAKANIKAYAVTVYDKDEIALWNDDAGQHVDHKPNPFASGRGLMVGVFAAASTADGRPYVEPMNMEDIMRVAARSKQCYVDRKTGQVDLGGTWKSDFERMAQKSALHRIRKRLPILDEDALQNLKDMEEESDFEGSGRDATSTQTTQPASSSARQGVLPAPDTSQDEVLRPAAGAVKRPRRSRVLAGVVEQAATVQTQQAPAKETPKEKEPAAAQEYEEGDIL